MIQPQITSRTFNTFLFDLDGTLLDTLPDLVVLTNKALAAEGFPPRTRDEIHHFVGNGLKALMDQAVPEGTSPEAAARALDAWKQIYRTYGNPLTKPYPHMPQTLRALRAAGCKLGVVSNKFDEGVYQIINLRLPGMFDIMHGESADYPRKPNPAGLLKSIQELDSTVEDTAYVGDSPGDVRTARNAGVFSIGVTWGYHPREDFMRPGAEPDLLINDVRELLKLVKS